MSKITLPLDKEDRVYSVTVKVTTKWKGVTLTGNIQFDWNDGVIYGLTQGVSVKRYTKWKLIFEEEKNMRKKAFSTLEALAEHLNDNPEIPTDDLDTLFHLPFMNPEDAPDDDFQAIHSTAAWSKDEVLVWFTEDHNDDSGTWGIISRETDMGES